MANDNRQIPFRFPTAEMKAEFQIHCVKLHIPMNKLLGEIVTRYLQEQKEVA